MMIALLCGHYVTRDLGNWREKKHLDIDQCIRMDIQKALSERINMWLEPTAYSTGFSDYELLPLIPSAWRHLKGIGPYQLKGGDIVCPQKTQPRWAKR